MSNIHDLIFFIGTVILIWGPFKMVRARVTPPVSATLLTALPLTAFMINYGTMNYWWSALAQAIQTSLWAILVWRGLDRKFNYDKYLIEKTVQMQKAKHTWERVILGKGAD